jgi:hypothetical protein
MIAKGRNAALIGERNHASKLTSEKVKALRSEHSAGTSERSLSRKYGVARITIKKITLRELWRHVE